MEKEKLMNTVDEAKEQVLREIKMFTNKKDVAPNEWENFERAMSILEKCVHICHMEEENDYMQFEERSGGAMTHHMPLDSYNYRTGRRYSDGRFAPKRSGHSINDRIIDRLERMYDEAQTDHEREVLGAWIDKVRMDAGGV